MKRAAICFAAVITLCSSYSAQQRMSALRKPAERQKASWLHPSAAEWQRAIDDGFNASPQTRFALEFHKFGDIGTTGNGLWTADAKKSWSTRIFGGEDKPAPLTIIVSSPLNCAFTSGDEAARTLSAKPALQEVKGDCDGKLMITLRAAYDMHLVAVVVKTPDGQTMRSGLDDGLSTRDLGSGIGFNTFVEFKVRGNAPESLTIEYTNGLGMADDTQSQTVSMDPFAKQEAQILK